MQVVFKVLCYPIKIVCFLLIYFYKFVISPILPKKCKFYPTCSSYTLQSIKEFGTLKGICLGIKRISKCVPWNKDEIEDYVPFNIKGDKRWIF